MGNAAGVRRDFAGLERRRPAAAELLRQGMSQSEVARRLGVHRGQLWLHLPGMVRELYDTVTGAGLACVDEVLEMERVALCGERPA